MNAPDSRVRLESADLAVEILPLGASVHRFEVRQPDGSWRNIVLGHRDLQLYRTDTSYLGSTLGRCASRITDARFALDGRTYVLDANEPPNCRHGGVGGFHALPWTVESVSDRDVRLGLTSPDGDQGFPGELQVTATYTLIDGGVQVVYTAVTDAPTVVSLTTHPYFNLNGEGTGTCDDHVLTVHADAYTPTRADGIPTGEIRPVAGTAADLRAGRELGAARVAACAEGIARNDGFDHNFVVNGSGMREHSRLVGPSGLSVTVVSDQPCLQVYGGDHFDSSLIGPSGRPIERRAGVALETQRWPDAPNRPEFPPSVLRPGEVSEATTRWMVGWE